MIDRAKLRRVRAYDRWRIVAQDRRLGVARAQAWLWLVGWDRAHHAAKANQNGGTREPR